MANEHSFRGLLHRATHRIPGISPHAERPAGHQGKAVHGQGLAPHPSPNHGWNHSPDRPPRFLPAWQRRIAAFFGRER
ncbi:hypothetical protein [Phytohabitans aurantiacus]|uniref:Uncharacterized protein n=1 Tax=Phytohabitans aurantiacus TaxID=3016789 RepID=A0ABQ5QWC5_9ACTN|nr:hypothetical protein [Phytohabitans aurantiacus]GLH98585.1 hypothetical protein Pa4123_38600 [Phytohabitans aurantiacus]